MLTENTVKELFFKTSAGLDTSFANFIKVHGASYPYYFDSENIKKSEAKIDDDPKELLEQFSSGESACYFKNVCLNKDGHKWTGSYVFVEWLMAMGITTGKVTYLLGELPQYLLAL